MAQDNIHKMYERLSTRFDLGTEEQFRDYVTASTDNSKKMYKRMSTRFELGSEQEWLDFMGGAKQQRETAAAKGDAEGASTFSEAEIKAETAAAEPQPANDLPIPQTQGKSTSSTPTPGAWPYAGAHRMQDGYVVSNAPGRDTGWRLTNEDGTPRTWAENVEATKTDEQRTREQFGEHRSGMVQDLLTDHAKTKAVPSERVVVDSEGNEVERYEVTPELSQKEAEYQARDDYYKKVKLDGERWAELEAARKQVYDEYNKELGKAHKEISELYQYVDAGAPVDFYVWVSNSREVKALKGALKYYDDALRMVKEARAVNDSPNNFLGELAGLGRGLLDAGLDVSTWDMGMSDLDQGASTLSAILKLEAGKELTSAEQRLLAAAAANTYANSSLGEQMGMGYKAGQTTMMSVPFMIEMALNPASGLGSAGSKALSKHLIKKYGREMIQKQLKKRLARQTMAAKWGTKIGGDAASASVMTLTSGAAMTAADAVDRMTGTIKPTEDEEGNIVYGGRDDDYEKNAWTAARKAIGSGAIERHTEMVGGYIPAMKTAGATFLAKKMKAATNPRLRKIYREAEELLSGKAFGKWGEMVGKVADVTKLNDLAGEFFEEKIGEVENAILVGDMKFDANSQTGIFNLDRNIETLVGLLPMQVFFGGMTALGYRTQKYRTNQALNKANKAAWETFGEDWTEMKDMIDGCETDKDLTKVVRGIISGGTTDLRSQAAVMQYVSAVQRQKGLQLVAETAPEIVAQAEAEDAAAAAMPQPTENTGAADAAVMPQPTENGGATSQTAYDRGVAAAEADDYAAMSDIGYEADLADARIERMFEEAQRAEIAEAENTEGGLETWLESNRENLSAEQAFAVQALIDANDAYDGLTETVRHRTASEEEAIRQEMQPLATADGRIVPLTLDNGQTLYLKSGDPTNRRSTVIAAYRDETGAVRNTQVSGMSITSIGTEQSLSDYALEAMGSINNERQQRIKDAMDGKNVAAGQTVRLYAGDELQEYKVTTVVPEGVTLRSKIDGSKMTMTTEELQDELAMSRQKRIENDLAAAMPQPTENTEGAVTAAAQPQLTEAAKEEERRKPLRARVAQWSQDIGADIEIHEDTSSITSSAVLNQINSGQGRVRGWYDNATGKVHVYMPGITDEHDIDETVIHEIVAHKGLRQLMGPRFDALCDKVYEMMSEDARQKYLAYPGVNGDTRAAADEYMAYLAENMENLTAEEQNVWQAIVAAVREFIKSVMTGNQMTDAQIEQLIRASYLNMKAQKEQATEAAAEPQLTDNTRAAVAAEREQTVEAAAQVAEKENLESQENAEKNVSLQTKEGRMGVVARQKNSAARLAKAKEIYGSDPTTSSFFDDMDVPQTAEELVAMTLVPRSINWEGIDRGTQHIRGLQEEMGRNKKRGIGRNFDTNGFNLYLAKKGEGVGIEKLVEDIWRSDKNGMGEGNMLGDQRRFDEHEIKDALLSLLSGAQTSKDISDYVLNNRIAQAEAAIEYMEEEAAYEQELYEQERREDAKLAGILELTEEDWLQMEAEYADQIAEIEAKEREQREIFQQILEQDHQQAEYYGRANQEEVASERGIRMAEESAERGTAGSAERGETVLRGAQDTREEGLSVGDAQLSEGALGAQNGRDGRSEDVHTQEAERSDVGETEAVPQFTEELERQKAETNTNPTEAQKEAGNYKKGHLTFGGYKFTIENPKGSVRSGKNKKGKAWKVTMPVTYGYILGKKGKDGDHLDMFINDKADLSTWNGSVFVVDQVNPETGEFDEHKIMYGFNDITDAMRAYLMSYTRPWRGMGNITEVSKEKFDEWVASSDRKLKPFAETRFGDKADVGTKVIRAAEERAGKRQEGETPEQDRDKQIEKAYKRGYNSYRREQYTDETLLEMYASMSNEAIEADISKMEQSIEEEKAYKDSEEYQERRSNESSDYTRAQTEGVAARAGKSVKALETKIAEAKRVLELRSMEERSAEEEEQVSFSVKPMLGNKNLTKGLRELEEGETCQVERIFTENKNFEFSSVNKVESYDDIAYIFKQLEDEAVENSFAVLVKRGKPTVIHLGMGHYTGTIVNQGVLTVAVNRVKPDKIYFVHNHPSGQLKASIEDIRVWQNLWEQYGSKLANGIIINTRSGKYGIFNNERSFDIATPSTSDADSKPLKVYSFNKQVFSKDYKPEGQIFNSEDVAKFVSSHRLGDRQKLGLILTNNKEITGNIFLPYSEITTYNARAIVNDIIYYTSVMGGTRAFMFGNVPLKDLRQKGISDLVAVFSNLRLVDYIEIDGGRYKSAADEDVSFSVVDDGTAAMPQYTEEEQGIVDEAKKSGTWMKAPNGKATNLTEKQWAQVRTKAFKDWFGDWELANLLNRASIAWNDKTSKGKVVMGLSERAKSRFNELLGTDIKQLVITDDAIRHIKKKHGENEELRGQKNMTPEDVVVIPYLINNFDSMELNPKENDNKGNRAIEIRKRINGISVIATIERGDNKEFLVTSYQYLKSDALDASNETPGLNVRNDSDIAKVRKDIENIKSLAKNSSKIVDENGEPMVVYHGSMHHNFTVFKNNGSGIYFTPDKEAADYGLDADPYAVFINMREPLNLDFEGDVDNEATENHDSLENEYKNAIAEGYDGVVAENTFDGENEMTQIVVHRSNQIKSATDNVGTFDEGNDDIRFSVANNNQEIFVSNAEQAVKNIKQEKATPQQWKAMIQSKGGLKAGEDKWLGLSEWLDEQETAKRSLTRQEVLDFIGENKIRIEEVEYSVGHKYLRDPESGDYEFTDEAFDEIERRYGNIGEFDYFPNEYFEFRGDVNDKLVHARTANENAKFVKESYYDFEDESDVIEFISYVEGSLSHDIDSWIEGSANPENVINSTRLDYTTKGLENKREIALTVPTIESWNESDDIHFGDAGQGRAVAWARFGETTDSEGNSVLVIDEIQSKRHQEGREKGYRGSFKVDEQKVKELRDELSAVRKRKKDIVPDEITGIIERAAYRKSLPEDLQAELRTLEVREQQITMEIGNLTRIPNGIPDAPFDKNWYELAMKRMLRLAAEEGFDKVAWTKGEQQAERYNIGAVLQGLKAYKTNTNKYYVIPYNNGAIGEFVKEYTEQELADTFGKELAQNIITNTENATEETPYEIVGEDLRIGGEGMKGFYDKMLPSFMNKYGKKWGVKVEEVELPEVEEAGRTMWSVDVTPEMKESVMEGQVMFSVKDKNANNLVVMHNISEGDLRKVLETGGLIMPSIAITDVNIGFSGFGDISLLFDKETINPSDRRNKVYGGDAWTPRFPQLVPKLNKEKVKSVADKLYELLSKDLQDYFGLSSEVHSGNIEDNIIRGGIASYYSKDFMKIAYLLDNGKKFKVPMKPKSYGRLSEIIIRLAKEKGVSLDDINNAGYEFYENNTDFVDAIKLADAEARTQNLSSEVREKVRDMILEKPMHFSTFDRAISAARSMEYDLNNGGLKQVVDGGALYEAINKKVKTDNADYNKWVDDLFDGIIEKYGIRNDKDWYTPSGNRRSWEQLYDAATPSNILRYMIASNAQGGSGGLFDSSIFGASAEEYKSIEEIRERGKKRLRKEDSDDYDEWTESVTSRISDIKNEFLTPSERNDFRSSADANDAIVRAVAKDKTAKGIYSIMKRDYRNFTMEHAKMVADIVKEIQDKSVTYFEAKPQRIVPLSEIRKAIVPSNVDSDIIEGLQKNGIEVATYRRGNENARNRLIKKESNEIRFSFIGEQGASNLDKAEEATTRLDNLNVAREMEEAGKDAKSIKMATGWERGADKKWRYEVEDKMEGIASPMDKLTALYREYKAAEKSFDRLMETSNRLPRLPRTATEEQKAKRKEFDNRLKEARETWLAKRETFMEADNRRNFTLEEILGADHELFAAYPQLKTREVSYMDKSDFAGYSGLYMPESGNFWISPTADNPMSVLTHEIQHAIQHIEGFAQGGNTHSSTKKIAEVMNVIGAPNGLPFNNLVSYLENGMETRQQHKQLLAMAEANGYDDIVDYVESLNPYGYYHRLSGEVEARNAAERMGMTAEERRASLAAETEDVAREDQVFIFDGLESAAMPQSTKLSASIAMSWKEGSEKPNSEVSADELRFRESSIEEFGESLGGTKVQFADSERFADDADAMERIERGDKGWYDTATGEVVIITENCADEADMARALLHEKLGHEGLAALLGGEKGVMKWGEYIWKSASESLRKRIAQRADKEGYPLSDRNRWSKAAQEVFADMASEGTMSNDEYSLWTKARHYVYRALKALNIRIPGSMTDADLRYYVKKTAEALKKTAAKPQTTENREHYEGSRMAARGDGRPRKKRNESQAQYNQRLLEWERRQVANENDPAPEMPELSAEEIRQEYNEYQRGWMARHGLPEDYEPGVTVGDENAQIFDREKHDSNDPYIEMLGYIPEAMRRWREEYHAWEQRNALGEAENVDLLLYNGESSNRPDDATSMEAEARLGNTLRERTIFDEISEAVGFDNTPEGAKRHAKNAVINRRKELESASAEDAIFIQGLGKKIDGIAKRLNVKSKDVRSALITLIELPIMRKNKEQAEQEALETINTSEAMNNAHTKLTLDNLRELREQIGNMLSKHVRHKEDQNNQEKWYELYEAAMTLSDALNQMNAGNEGYVALYADDVIAAYKQFEAAYAATAELPSSELLDKLENDETTKELLGEIKDWYDLMYHYIENAGLRGDAGYIAEGYVNHIWDKSKSDPEAYDRYVRLKSANMRHREIPTYADGIAVGLVPKFTDILDIMSYYSRQNIEAVSNRHLLDNLLNLCVDVKNTDGEVVQQLPVVTTASPSFGDRSRYERYEIPGISGDVWVLKDVKGWFNAIFGTERTPGIGPKMRSAAKAYDVLSGILKTIQLSFSFFHAGALTEVSVAQQGPIKGFKDILKYIIVESAFKGTMPAYAHPADFKLAASHLVQLGATKDYAAAEVAGFYDKIHEVMQDFRKEHPNPLTWTGELAAALPKYLNKGMSIMLWEYLHDGLKIALFKKLAGDVDKRLLHIYNTGQQGTNQYEDFATWQESKAYRILREQMLDEAGQYVNDTFGGQYWELMNVSPTLIKWLRRALLSPDWLISTQRHFFSMFGFGSLYSEGNFREWIKYNTDNLQRLLGKDVPRNELRRMRSKNAKECYLIGVAIFYYAAFNIINAIARAGDEDDEKKKAEEIRKTNPDYKSPYELAYPDGMKWWEYTMLGNSPRHETHLFLGRYEDGTEYYVRWGKQFREFPELFIGKNGFEFPGPLIERMKGKSNPLLRYTEGAFGVLDIHGYNAPYDMQEMRDKYGKEITLLAYTAQQFLPFSVPTQEDKEFKLLDLAMPSQKGFTRWKAVNYFEDFIVSGEMDGIERTYKAAVMNGINAEECLQAAIARVKATQRKEMGDGITDLQGAYERFDASKDLAERKLMRQKMRKYLSQSGWKNFSKADAVEKVQEFINGGSKEYEANNGANDSYLMAATAADIAEDWRIDSLYQLTTPIAKELKDMKNAGVSAQEVNAYAKNHEKMLEARKTIGSHRRVINILKRDIALHKDSAMTNIREKRKELLETLGENKPENK